MKAYSLGSNRRVGVSLSIMAFAVGMSGITIFLLDHLPMLVTHLPGDHTLVSFLEWGGILLPVSLPICFWLFNRFMWRWPVIRHLIDLPDMNGIWVGSLDRKEYGDEKDSANESGVPVILHIRQRFFDMSVCLENPEASTKSGPTMSSANTIGLMGDRDGGYMLDFTFGVGSLFGVNTLSLSNHSGSEVLSGEYVSSFPRKGTLSVTRLRKNETVQRSRIRKLRSQSGETYLGVLVRHSEIRPYQEKLETVLSTEKSQKLRKNRADRDGNSHHLTVVSPPEFEELSPKSIAQFEDKVVSFLFTGIGSINRENNEAWFVTAVSQHIAFLRAQAGLPSKDFHVTLGFDASDIHDHPKDESTWVPSLN